MKQIIYNIGAIGMALLVLVSTVSFTVDKHYCGSMLMDMAIMHKAEACAMAKTMNQRSCDSSAEKPGCCTDENILVEGQENLKFSLETISLDDQQFLVTFALTYLQAFRLNNNHHIPLDVYVPPLPKRDVQVLHQTFLI